MSAVEAYYDAPQAEYCCVFCSYGSVKCPPIQWRALLSTIDRKLNVFGYLRIWKFGGRRES